MVPKNLWYFYILQHRVNFKIETDHYHFFEPIPIFEDKYRPIISGMSYHCKVLIRISADIQTVKYRPIISVGRYIGRFLV